MNHVSTKRPSKSLTAPTEKRVCLRWAVVVFAAVASLLMAVACAPAKKNAKTDGSATFVTTLPTADAQKAYSNSILTCETKNKVCPDAIGLLVSKFPNAGETEVSQCTSFLVSPNIVATNSHCIPTDLRAPGSKCLGRVQVLFGKTAEVNSMKYDCDQVLSATEIVDDKNNPEFGHRADYAFIRLNRAVIKRQPLKFSRLGLQENLPLNVLAIDPSPDTSEVRGTLRLKKCVATQNSMAAQGFTHDFAPVAAAVGCKTIQGNSGSPMLDNAGQVRGILYGSNTDLSITGSVEIPKEFELATLLSNTACIQVPDGVILPGERNSACGQASEPNLFDTLLKRTPLKAEPLFNAWKSKTPLPFEFELRRTANEGTPNYAYPSPTCLKPLANWAEAPNKNADGSVTLNFEVPVWSQIQALNANLQASVSTKQTTTVKFQTIVRLTDLEKNEPTYIEEVGQSANGLISQSRKGHVPLCN